MHISDAVLLTTSSSQYISQLYNVINTKEAGIHRNKPNFTIPYLVLLIFLIISLLIHAGKEVDAVRAYQVNWAFALEGI